MEIETEKYKGLIRYVLGKLRELENEVLAYRVIHAALNAGDPELAAVMRRSFDDARISPLLKQKLDEKYEPILDKLLKRIDEASLGQEFEEWIREWKPSDPVN